MLWKWDFRPCNVVRNPFFHQEKLDPPQDQLIELQCSGSCQSSARQLGSANAYQDRASSKSERNPDAFQKGHLYIEKPRALESEFYGLIYGCLWPYFRLDTDSFFSRVHVSKSHTVRSRFQDGRSPLEAWKLWICLGFLRFLGLK